jgi:hypothetical protein
LRHLFDIVWTFLANQQQHCLWYLKRDWSRWFGCKAQKDLQA